MSCDSSFSPLGVLGLYLEEDSVDDSLMVFFFLLSRGGADDGASANVDVCDVSCCSSSLLSPSLTLSSL